MTEFAKLIQNKRKEKGYTLEELANKLNVDKSYISKLENDKVPAPSVNLIRRISEVLLIDFEQLSLLAGRITDSIIRSLDIKKVELFRAMKDKNFSEENYKKLLKQIKNDNKK
ncbi:MAG: helix-turn-helix transcriptional regulator [Parcubacteria group bacterium]|nr:helix-turn-helix transcriptional regulator [Parcubacteria group bacterium]